jgi:hypothetical protein
MNHLHLGAAQWVALAWLSLGILVILRSKIKTASKINQTVAVAIWIALLYWGGFWS